MHGQEWALKQWILDGTCIVYVGSAQIFALDVFTNATRSHLHPMFILDAKTCSLPKFHHLFHKLEGVRVYPKCFRGQVG
jgi:hypothetical protein